MKYFTSIIGNIKNVSIPHITFPVKSINIISMLPNTTGTYDTVVNTFKNINYSNMIPNYTRLYDNSITNGVMDNIRSIRVTSMLQNYNPLSYPSRLIYMINNFMLLHICRLVLVLMVSLWLSIFIMRFMLNNSISLCNLTFIIFLNLLFLIYYPSSCF